MVYNPEFRLKFKNQFILCFVQNPKAHLDSYLLYHFMQVTYFTKSHFYPCVVRQYIFYRSVTVFNVLRIIRIDT